MGFQTGPLSGTHTAALLLNQVQAELAGIEADVSKLASAAAPIMPNAIGDGDGNGNAGMSFADNLNAAIRSVDAKEQHASERIAAVQNGRSDDLVGAMLSSQEASLSFSMLMQVRNKVVGAVDELIKLQL